MAANDHTHLALRTWANKTETLNEEIAELILAKVDKEKEVSASKVQHEQQKDLPEIDRTINFLENDYKQKEVEFIAAKIKYFRYIRDILNLYLAKVEAKLSNEQLEYLREYYITNKFPRLNELQAIGKQWNIDHFSFVLHLEDWFCGRRMAEEEVAQRRYVARTLAA